MYLQFIVFTQSDAQKKTLNFNIEKNPDIFSVVLFNATFLQYFKYIVAVNFISGENHRPVASH
jgi:hypothetical protein